MASKSGSRVLGRQLTAREKLWPGVTNFDLWYRGDRDGFITVPRLMPLMMNMMDELAGKGFPVGHTYFEMWCRLYDEAFLSLNKPDEMAYHSGFTGQRAVRTWRDRVGRLKELAFIDVKPGPMGDMSYALFWNPYHVLRKHYEEGRIREDLWITLVMRANEIGATDIEDPPRKAREREEKKSESKVAARSKARARSG